MSENTSEPARLDPFQPARALFETLATSLQSAECLSLEHGALEAYIKTQGREVLRQLLQSHLDVRARQEKVGPMMGPDGIQRTHLHKTERKLVTQFGEVRVYRKSAAQREVGAIFPMDAALNLPPESFSSNLQLEVSAEVARGSFSAASDAVERETGIRIGTRQIEEIAVRAAEDFDRFYETRRQSEAPKPGALLVLTMDGKGVIMREDGLRSATRKAAERAASKETLDKEKANRKRMAIVAAVYEIAPWIRRPQDILDALDGKGPEGLSARPRPAHKRAWASLVKPPKQVIAHAFEEASRRDPERRHSWIVLVDGNATQIEEARKQGKKHGVKLTLILDFIHVSEYVWKAGRSLYPEGDPGLLGWVRPKLEAILCGKAAQVASQMQQEATARGMSKEERKQIDSCVTYLENHLELLEYDQVLSMGCPIATGVIEGACRYLVKDRMDITGARWGLTGAEAVLRLRALYACDDLTPYWMFHQQQEFERNHADFFRPEDLPAVTPRWQIPDANN